MIVFWRLLLAYYICAVLFYNRTFFAWRDRRPVVSLFLQGTVFFVAACLLCRPYLGADWPFADLWNIPGWLAAALAASFYMLGNRLFVNRKDQRGHYTLTFLVHDFLTILFLFLCSPLKMLAESGNFVADPWTVFGVGVLVVTKMFSVFIYMAEQDLYGRDLPTMDESFVTMLMRLIFYLIVLLPGWRWAVWFVVWLWACRVARRNRLMDFSRFALYFSAFGAVAVGFLTRWSWYLRI